jgi:transcriptional regulator with XRE-family HTH domain
MYISSMRTIQELGAAVRSSRKALRLRQKDVAAQAGISAEALLRLERGHSPEFGSRKPLAILAVLGMEIAFTTRTRSGSLDELRRERQGK